jgi:hypothetical protein
MRRVLTLFSLGLLYAGASAGQASCDHSYWTEKSLTRPGIVLATGIEGFQVGRPSPELLEKLGPLLCATGSEELRVGAVAQHAAKADPIERAASPERTIRLVEFIRGREVRQGWVNISLNIQTNEVMYVKANFLPDRGIDHLPRLSPGQAKAKAAAGMRQTLYDQTRIAGQEISFSDTPAHLAYEIEQFGFRPPRGVLVWIFSAQVVESHEWYSASIDASTGQVVKLWTEMIH